MTDEEGLALVWAWRYQSLTCRSFETLWEAISSADYAADNGSESLECIEFFGQDGQRRTLSLSDAQTIEDARQLEHEALMPPPKPIVARIWVRSPGGKEVLLDAFWDMAEAREEFAKLAPLGERARLEEVRPSHD